MRRKVVNKIVVSVGLNSSPILFHLNSSISKSLCRRIQGSWLERLRLSSCMYAIMEGVNVLDAVPPRKPLTLTKDNDGLLPHPSTKVDYHLNNLLALHLSNPDLTPLEIAEASRSTAADAAVVAKAARATADQKAAAAAKAIAAAKSALGLIASFPNKALVPDASLSVNKDKLQKHVAAADLLYESPSKLQTGDVPQGIVPNSSSSFEHEQQHVQCKVPIGSRETLNKEHSISKRVNFSGLGMELDPNRLNESAGEQGAKEQIQVTRKRGRPKSK